MTNYKTPNVYIEEISSSPPSVVTGATAVPAFIGYTAIAGKKIKSIYEYHNKPVRITSLIEYEKLFGKAYFSDDLFNFNLTNVKDNRIRVDPTKLKFLLYYQIQMYFSNGGGVCYIVSSGQYGDDKNISLEALAIQNGLDALKTEDEPTIIVLTDAINLDEDKYYAICQQALAQCKELKDRFVILDVPGDINNINEHFRTKIGQNNLQYGAAYYPYLDTSFSYAYEDSQIVDSNLLPCFLDINDEHGNPALRIISNYPNVKVVVEPGTEEGVIEFHASDENLNLTITVSAGTRVRSIFEKWNQLPGTDRHSFNLIGDATDNTPISETLAFIPLNNISSEFQGTIELSTKVQTFKVTYSGQIPKLEINRGDDAVKVTKNIIEIGLQTGDITVGDLYTKFSSGANAQLFSIKKLNENVDTLKVILKPQSLIVPTLETMKGLDSKLYFEVKDELDKLRITLPPSAAVAGVYVTIDKDRGVWKAPANFSINGVVGPKTKVTNAEQEDLNVHDSGKSINVIRSFTGKGTLVWGSRTLAGNDNEWRYVPVRRLFNSIEKAIKNSTSFAVFEPNTEMTWLKVRVMVENYLNDLWSQGALAGNKAEDAYFVQVGLGKTMTAQDISEGRMIAKVGVAAVRPAEFIIMQFSHLVQKS